MVMTQAAKVFVYVAQALEAETLTGQTAIRVVAATKLLLEATGTNGDQLLQQHFTPEAGQTIRGHFG